MVSLKLAFLALASGCNALTVPAGRLALSLPSYDDPVHIFAQSRAPTPSNSTGSALGGQILPEFFTDLNVRCAAATTPPFQGGQLIYSLISELSTLWRETDNPIIKQPIRTRNLPFYSIQITISPERSSFTQAQLAIYMFKLVRGLVTQNINAWPGPMNCRLEYGGTYQLLGKLDVDSLPITTSGLALSAAVNHTLATFGGNSNLGADGISFNHAFQGAKTTDRNALYLFTSVLLQFYQRSPNERLTELIPPGRPTKLFLTPDRTFGMRMQTYAGLAAQALSVKDFAEGIIRMLLLMAVRNRWESFGGDIYNDVGTIGSVYMAPNPPNAEGSGQNWSA